MSESDPTVFCATLEEWEAWLGQNHEHVRGVWLKIAKKGTGIDSARYPEVLDAAIAHGWIDAVRHGHDDEYFLQRFTPRGPRSKWSKINRDKATELIDSGLMTPAGLREVEKAKADGRWNAAYDSQRNITVPDDLQRELDADPKAREFFESLNSQNRYAILYRLHEAKKPETRARRLEQFVTMLKEGKKLHP
ncbi:MAG: YdeI/OmpD-associated family protein [Thermoleophilaceae bacterium]